MKSRVSILDDEELDFFDFKLIAISCHLKDYKLCWKLNSRFLLDLKKTESDIEVLIKKNKSLHPLYVYENPDEFYSMYLIKNRSEGFLIPEQPNADYFLKLEGEINEVEILKKLKEIPEILTAYFVDVINLKSRENLIF